ncbi:MAG TPA: FhaA domain-containing protein [Candidatus Limnocylindrales bacterium]|nr:FhaA domain-containing protein [Candidatus Limnocylindrales bacterium]
MKNFLKNILLWISGKSEFYPEQLKKALEEHMERYMWILPTETYVPHAYKIRLHPKNFQQLSPTLPRLQEQLTYQLNQRVLEKGYKLITTPISISFVEDRTLTTHFAIDLLPPVSPQEIKPAQEPKVLPPFKKSGKTPEKLLSSASVSKRKGEGRRVKKEKNPELKARDEKPGSLRPPTGKPTAFLEVLSGEPMKGKKFSLIFHKTILGRSPLADIRFPADMLDISDRHAIIHYDKERYYIEDANSSTGTYVNETSIKKVKLEPGAEIRIGKVIMRFMLES